VDAMVRIDGVPKILQPMPETETLHVRRLMLGTTKPVYKHEIFFVCLFRINTSPLQTTKSGGWEGAPSCSHSGDVGPKEVLTLKH